MTELAEALSAHQAGELERAEALYRQILARGPDYHALGNLGAMLSARGAFDESESLLLAAIAMRPEGAVHRRNLGVNYLRRGQLAQAETAFRATLAIDPDDRAARLGLGNVLLALGQEAEGWTLYDERPERARTPARRLSYPEWQGEPLAGKRLFILGEQGHGDQLFAARYVANLGHEATIACAPALVRVFEQLPGVRALPRIGKLSAGGHDFWTMPLSLPRWLAPATAPYLQASPRPSGGRIGLMWRGQDKPDPGRSLPADQAARLLSLPGVISLQPEDTGARDFQDTAEIITGLARVISIDTSVAHLAGALGAPGTVLLQHDPRDWRWREASPGRSYWYPSLAIRRQPAPGDWCGLVDAIAAEIAEG